MSVDSDITLGQHPSFKKKLKKLSSKYRHLEDDFSKFEKALKVNIRKGEKTLSRNYKRIKGTCVDNPIFVYKARDFRSKDFPGKGAKSGFRIIFIYNKDRDEVIYIDIYHKKKQNNHDIDLINTILKEII
jgi:mRNA-degrading endonuclease RelE of RelBE toxin-antitoxin system